MRAQMAGRGGSGAVLRVLRQRDHRYTLLECTLTSRAAIVSSLIARIDEGLTKSGRYTDRTVTGRMDFVCNSSRIIANQRAVHRHIQLSACGWNISRTMLQGTRTKRSRSGTSRLRRRAFLTALRSDRAVTDQAATRIEPSRLSAITGECRCAICGGVPYLSSPNFFQSAV